MNDSELIRSYYNVKVDRIPSLTEILTHHTAIRIC